MKAGRILKNLEKKLAQAIDSLLPQPAPQLAPARARSRKPRGRR